MSLLSAEEKGVGDIEGLSICSWINISNIDNSVNRGSFRTVE